MPTEKRRQDKVEAQESQYRGRTIRVERPAKERGRVRLLIDDVEVEVEETDSGVTSHLSMFKEYGSVEELAEDLIRQHGNRPVTGPGDGGHHGHEGGGRGRGGHDHDHDHDHDHGEE